MSKIHTHMNDSYMAKIIPFFQPETKINEIAQEITLYINTGKYLQEDKDKLIIEQFKKDISFLPEKRMKDYCNSLIKELLLQEKVIVVQFLELAEKNRVKLQELQVARPTNKYKVDHALANIHIYERANIPSHAVGYSKIHI